MRITIVAALCLIPGASQAACMCTCVQGRATNVCSNEPGGLDLPVICQRICMDPVTTPLNLSLTPRRLDEGLLGPRQENGIINSDSR